MSVFFCGICRKPYKKEELLIGTECPVCGDSINWDMWKTRTKHRFRTKQAAVVLVDCIGRETRLPASDGFVEIELTGAPLAVLGLELD